MNLEIRKANKTDLDRLFDLWAQMQYPHSGYHPDYYPMADDDTVRSATLARLDGMLENPDILILVASVDDQIVGYCISAIQVKPPVFLPVKQMLVLQAVVDHAYRRRGVFSRLHSRLCEWGIEQGASEAELMVDVLNPAIAVYEHMGYKPVQYKMVAKLAT